MPSVVVPHFRNRGVQSWITKESWNEIFDGGESQFCDKFPATFYRKLRTVRLAAKDGIYFSLAGLLGLRDSHNYSLRRVYGEVLFHTRHNNKKEVPYQSQTQLMVSCGRAVYSGEVCSVTVYLLPKTRLSEMTFSNDPSFLYDQVKRVEVTDRDYTYGLMRTNKMVCDFDYSIPPLREE